MIFKPINVETNIAKFYELPNLPLVALQMYVPGNESDLSFFGVIKSLPSVPVRAKIQIWAKSKRSETWLRYNGLSFPSCNFKWRVRSILPNFRE